MRELRGTCTVGMMTSSLAQIPSGQLQHRHGLRLCEPLPIAPSGRWRSLLLQIHRRYNGNLRIYRGSNFE